MCASFSGFSEVEDDWALSTFQSPKPSLLYCTQFTGEEWKKVHIQNTGYVSNSSDPAQAQPGQLESHPLVPVATQLIILRLTQQEAQTYITNHNGE